MDNQKKGISSFQKNLTWWVLGCMLVGVLIGRLIPAIPDTLGRLEISGISMPIAILIWVMIYPMMMKVDFRSVKQVGKNPKGLFLTWIVNWLIKPFTMYGIAYLFLYIVFQSFITPDLAKEYLAGAVLLGAAPCTAMVFVWSTLTRGNPAYTVVQVATNDLIILVAFVPIVKFLLGVSDVSVPYSTLFVSVILFVVIPLAAGIITRLTVIKNRGQSYFETVTLLSHQSKEHVIIGIDTEEVVNDNSLAAPTYKNIKEWIFETYGVKMHTAYIAQVKRKYGLPMRECSHKSKDKDYVPQVVSVEQEQMIVEALKHFKAIE